MEGERLVKLRRPLWVHRQYLGGEDRLRIDVEVKQVAVNIFQGLKL